MKNDIKRPSSLIFHSLLAFGVSFALLAFENNPYGAISEIEPFLSVGLYFLYVMVRQIVFLAFGIYIYNLSQSHIPGAIYICYFLLVATLLSDVFFVSLKIPAVAIFWQTVSLIYSVVCFLLSSGAALRIRALCIPMVLHSVFVLCALIYSLI